MLSVVSSQWNAHPVVTAIYIQMKQLMRGREHVYLDNGQVATMEFGKSVMN